MTFPVVASTNIDSGSGTTGTVDFPATVDAGDLILCLVATDGTPTLTKPTGWTEVYNSSHTTDNSYALWGLDAAGTEDGGTFDFTLSASESWAAVVFRISGWDDSGAITAAVEATIDEGIATSTPNPPSHTVSWATGLDNLWVAAIHLGAGPTCSVFPYADDNVTSRVAGGAGAHVSVCSYDTDAQDTRDPGTFTISSTIPPTTATIAVKPSGAAPPTVAPRLTLLGVG